MTTAEVFANGNANLIAMHRMLVHTEAEAMAELAFGYDRKNVSIVPSVSGMLMQIGVYAIDYDATKCRWFLCKHMDKPGCWFDDYHDAIAAAITATTKFRLRLYAARSRHRSEQLAASWKREKPTA